MKISLALLALLVVACSSPTISTPSLTSEAGNGSDAGLADSSEPVLDDSGEPEDAGLPVQDSEVVEKPSPDAGTPTKDSSVPVKQDANTPVEMDAGSPEEDSGEPVEMDAGSHPEEDASQVDSGQVDSGSPEDAGQVDSGQDSGEPEEDDAGTDAGTDAGPEEDAFVPECETGDSMCDGNTSHVCVGGSWQTSECPFTCTSGVCAGECVSGSSRCYGQEAQECVSGYWQTVESCQYVCTNNGTCSGECSPGATDCQGEVPRTCNPQGQWVASQACEFVCSAGACTGVCSPGGVQCSGSLIQTCNSAGQWDTATSCPSVNGADSYCSAGSCQWDCQMGRDDCDGDPQNGCEVDLEADSNNCGSCGHSCCGGACGSGTCEQMNAIGVPSQKWAADTDRLFWSDNTSVYSRNLTNGSDSLLNLVTGGTVQEVETDGQYVYFSVNSLSPSSQGVTGVFGVPVEGGSKTTYFAVDGMMPLKNLGWDAGFVYWTQNSSNLLYAPISLPGNWNPAVMHHVEALTPSNVAMNTDYYVSDGMSMYLASDASLYASDTPSGDAEPVSTNSNHFGELVTDGAYIYYVKRNSGVWKQPVGGGAETQIVSDIYIKDQLATDGTNVYYTNRASGKPYKLWSVSTSGGTPNLVSSLNDALKKVEVTNQCVFWADTQVHALSLD